METLTIRKILNGANRILKDKGNILIRVNDEDCWLTHQIVARSSKHKNKEFCSQWSYIYEVGTGVDIYSISLEYHDIISNLPKYDWTNGDKQYRLKTLIKALENHLKKPKK